nr:MAG TPA: hypothetical protein [Caudoviricetes sp.]
MGNSSRLLRYKLFNFLRLTMSMRRLRAAKVANCVDCEGCEGEKLNFIIELYT